MNLRQQQPTESGFSLKNIGTLALRKAGDALDAVSNGISSVSSRMRMDASAVLLSVGVIVGANNAVGCGLEVQGECDAECVDAVGKGGASGASGQGGMNVAGSGGVAGNGGMEAGTAGAVAGFPGKAGSGGQAGAGEGGASGAGAAGEAGNGGQGGEVGGAGQGAVI